MKRTDHAKARAAGWQDPLRPQQPLVSLRWLAGAFIGAALLAAGCAYAAFCVLFYQGSWQLVFRPSHRITVTPSSVGLSFQTVHFDATETGQLLLTGWWVPADRAALTVLLLHDGVGSLSDTVELLNELHGTGANIFAIDYRGFGESAPLHPSEGSMNADADAAWDYLTQIRRVPAASVVLYGVGTGAAIAAQEAQRHRSAAGLVLDGPGLSALALIGRDSRSRMLPVRLLTSDRLEPSAILAQIPVPKLFLDAASPGSPLDARTRQLFTAAAPPKQLALQHDILPARKCFFDTLASTQSERR